MSVLINGETAKSNVAFKLKGSAGEVELSQFDADLLSLVNQINAEDKGDDANKVLPERFVKGTPRYLLAALSVKYSHIDVKTVAGRLKFFKSRGYIGTEERKGLIFPGWAPTAKLTTLMSKLEEVSAAHPEKHQFEMSISNVDDEVLNETASQNGRYKVSRTKTDTLAGAVDELTVE